MVLPLLVVKGTLMLAVQSWRCKLSEFRLSLLESSFFRYDSYVYFEQYGQIEKVEIPPAWRCGTTWRAVLPSFDIFFEVRNFFFRHSEPPNIFPVHSRNSQYFRYLEVLPIPPFWRCMLSKSCILYSFSTSIIIKKGKFFQNRLIIVLAIKFRQINMSQTPIGCPDII